MYFNLGKYLLRDFGIGYSHLPGDIKLSAVRTIDGNILHAVLFEDGLISISFIL